MQELYMISQFFGIIQRRNILEGMIMKLFKRLLLFIVILLAIIFTVTLFVLKTTQVEVTNEDLPQTVYEENGDLLVIAQSKLLSIATFTGTDNNYTAIEEFMNYYILYLIKDKLNANYDPFNEDPTDETRYIVDFDYLYIDYLFAKITDDNQLMVILSFGSNKMKMLDSALYFYFDVSVDIWSFSMILTLDQVFWAETEISRSLLDSIFEKLGKESIEDAVTMGTLDLTDYTYTINLINP